MADKALVNLPTGLEDSERVTIAFLVAGAALERGREVAMFLTKEAVRLAVPGHAVGVACDGCPPLEAALRAVRGGRGRASGLPVLRQRPAPGLRRVRVTPAWPACMPISIGSATTAGQVFSY